MFRQIIVASLALLIGSQAHAQSESTSLESETRMEMSDVSPQITSLGINLQIGLSSFDYAGDDKGSRSEQGLASALTVEFGDMGRFVETGVTFYQSRSAGLNRSTSTIEEINNSHLGIPLFAKFYTSGGKDGLFIKTGMMTSFLLDSSKDEEVRNLDLVGLIGVGGKMKMSNKADFIIEGSYNRGFLDQLRSRGDTYQQGFVVTGGMAFQI